jgi:predicted component of type VI protein secretion system
VATLEVLSGAAKGQRVALDDARPNPVGSSQRSTARFTDGGVFFRHATIECRAGVWVVIDERSVSGTAVNGQRLARQTSHPLAHGDLLAFGSVEVRFLLEPAADAPAPGDELERLRARVVEVELRARTYADELARASYALTASDAEALRAQVAQLSDERDLLQLRLGEQAARAAALEARRVRDDELYEVIVRQRTHGDTECEADPVQARADAEWTKLHGEVRDLRAERDAALAERDRQAAAWLAAAERLRAELAATRAELTDRTAQLLALDEEVRASR